MTVAKQRNHASQLINQLDDEFFATVYAMLATYVRKRGDQVVGFRAGEELTASALNSSIAKAEQQIDRGEFLTPEELVKETEEWLNSTK